MASGRAGLAGLVTILITACWFTPVAAVEVYRWVDDDGVVHFSQWQPEGTGEPVQTVRVEDGATRGVGGDIYPVEELAEAIQALRDERRRERELARTRDRSSPPAPQPVAQYVYPVDYGIWPWQPSRPAPTDPPPRPEPPPDPEPVPSVPYRPPGQADDEP